MQAKDLVIVVAALGAVGWWLQDDLIRLVHPQGQGEQVVKTVIGPDEQQRSPVSRSGGASEVYSWRDEKGVMHYESRSDNAQAKMVEVDTRHMNTVSLATDKHGPAPAQAAPAPRHSSGGIASAPHQNIQRANSVLAQQQAQMNAQAAIMNQ